MTTFTLDTTHLTGSTCIVQPGDFTSGDAADVNCASCCSRMPSTCGHTRIKLSTQPAPREGDRRWNCGCGYSVNLPADQRPPSAAPYCAGLGGDVFYSESQGRWVESPCGACGDFHEVEATR